MPLHANIARRTTELWAVSLIDCARICPLWYRLGDLGQAFSYQRNACKNIIPVLFLLTHICVSKAHVV